jgi:Spy/CpxP family protein refolding chaperone
MARINAFRVMGVGRILVVTGALLAATVGSASAQGWGHGGGGPQGGFRLGVPLRALNLTPDQQTQVQAILTNARATARPIALQLRQAQSALADAMLASPAADVSIQVTAISGLQAQLFQNRVQTRAQVLGVLKPEQLARAAQIKAEMGQLRGRMRQLMVPSQP